MNKQNQSIVILPAFVLGLASLIGQVLLLRELIVVFYGNETVYAIVLASWLFWIAAGSFLASLFVRKITNPVFPLAVLYGAVAIVLPSSIMAARFIKEVMNFKTGEIIASLPMCWVSYLLLAPLTMILGSIFTLVCRLSQETSPAAKSSLPATVYQWESIGAAAGGIFFSFVLIHLLGAMHIAFLTGMMNIAVLMFLLRQEYAIGASKNILFLKSPNTLYLTAAFVFILAFLAYPSGLIKRFDEFTRRVQWKDFNIVSIVDSMYGNLALTKLGNEYSLFENGLLSYSTKDELTSEENTHYALLEHPHPKNILLIGSGLGGGLREILKHPVEGVDYVELDPWVIRVSKRHLPSEILLPLKDRRVRVIYSDGRFFVKRAAQKYDLIIVNLPDPTSALINRYYSLEFFKEAHRILNPNGILALSVSSSENYLSKEARRFLRCIDTTLKNAFSDVKSFPGDTNIFLACKQNNVLTYDAGILIKRLKSRHIQAKFVREYYLPFKLSKDRIAYIDEILKDKGEINNDEHPVAYFYDIVLWSTHFNEASKKLLEKLTRLKFLYLMFLPVILIAVGWLLRRKAPKATLVISMMNTGLSQIVFQLVVILAFQTLYGYVYYKVGLIMAAFMAGLGWGSFTAKKIIARTGEDTAEIYRIYKSSQMAVSVYPLFLLAVFSVFGQAVFAQWAGLLAFTFSVIPVIGGFIGGLQYPLAARLLSSMEKNENKNLAGLAGKLYGADTLGAALGALVTGTILIPLMGIPALAFFCASLNLAVWILLAISPQPISLSARV